MSWTVLFAEEFEPEFDELPEEVQDAILARFSVGTRGAITPTTARGYPDRTEVAFVLSQF